MATILVNANSDQTGAVAGLSAVAGTTYIVEQNAHLSADSFGFVALTDSVELQNFGGIFSATTDGLKLDGTDDAVFNQAGGSIAGTSGVLLIHSGETLTNLGSSSALMTTG